MLLCEDPRDVPALQSDEVFEAEEWIPWYQVELAGACQARASPPDVPRDAGRGQPP
eukprot:CAMPEP_0175788846 /NCGR_PEP_ID=MMETSP0097-20121207/81096_1 /TAXON_ID=311494 /ORGANISM="Alexandrium monilatum, Strain CCMP3105" /LENGTH=55 /DNA_ID=CAMNT_0017099885 /DNA_START=1 /DNA_END=166 /DNA_ORIENTATION=+